MPSDLRVRVTQEEIERKCYSIYYFLLFYSIFFVMHSNIIRKEF